VNIMTNMIARMAAQAAAVVLSFGVVVSAQANMLVNGDFETGDFTGWTVAADYTGVTAYISTVGGPESGNYFAALGAGGTPGTISQAVSTASGQNYNLSYWFASSGYTPNYFAALWNGVQIGASVEDNVGAFGWTVFNFTVVGTGSDTLTFQERNDISYQGLDNVSLTPSSVVPIPAAVWLLSSGLLGLAGVARKRNAIAVTRYPPLR
jgi:hypothetical protein